MSSIIHFGRLMVGWERRTPDGQSMLPWQKLTLDRLEPETRQVVARVARSAAQDFFEEQAATYNEAWSIELGKRVQEGLDRLRADLGLAAPQDKPTGLRRRVPKQKENDA
jgi:hypothetical protein